MSTIKVSNIQTPSGVDMYLCKAWVNFNGTGTPTIRAAGNVSSITDNGTGDYTINFTNPMPDANYSVVALQGGTASGGAVRAADEATARTTSLVRLFFMNTGGSGFDSTHNSVAIFR